MKLTDEQVKIVMEEGKCPFCKGTRSQCIDTFRHGIIVRETIECDTCCCTWYEEFAIIRAYATEDIED